MRLCEMKRCLRSYLNLIIFLITIYVKIPDCLCYILSELILVHITQISDKFVRHPSDVLKVGDIVTVWVLAVDVARGRISLTMKKPKEQQN